MGKLFYLMFAAAAAGLAAWAVTEPFAPPLSGGAAWARWEVFFALAVGGFIGAALGGVSGQMQGSRTHLARGFFGGMALGALGGVAGLQIGGQLANAIFGPQVFAPDLGGGGSMTALPVRILARTLVFIPFGALIGLVQGIGARSWPRAVQGLIGGVIGGAIGGAIFDIIGSTFGGLILAMRGVQTGEVGGPSRAIAAVCLGGAIGLLVGIVEMLSKKAWIRLELGRNEGKEWTVDAQQTFIGRSENAHVPLFGDPNVMPMHACIVRSSGNYRLVDGGSPMGIGVNGIRVPEALLQHGDIINIGGFSLRFLLKNPRAAAPSPVDLGRSAPPVAMGLPPAPVPQPQPPMPSVYSLVAIDGPLSGQRFPVQSEVVAGRESPGINLAHDSAASRRHASFAPSPTGVLVRDLGSTNGTFVNDIRVQEMALRPGDTVKVGSTTFRLES
jgi:pSer/pThr/pTyr-binding forkhead associated (FHA) protein